jgi:hypothetical protein
VYRSGLIILAGCSVTLHARHMLLSYLINHVPAFPFHPSTLNHLPAFRLLHRINELYTQNLQTYHDLYIWSCSHLDLFWGVVWDETNIIGHKGLHVIDTSALPVHNPTWYSQSPLLYLFAQHLLGLPMHVSIGLKICCIVVLHQS